MKNSKKIRIFLVDDDAVYLKLLEIEFLALGDLEIETYANGDECIAHLDHQPDIIILDYLLDGVDPDAMNGIEALDRIKAVNPDLPVIMLSAQDKIEVAIDCMHHKAFDYVVKSETAFLRLQKSIITILRIKKIETELNWYMERM